MERCFFHGQGVLRAEGHLGDYQLAVRLRFIERLCLVSGYRS